MATHIPYLVVGEGHGGGHEDLRGGVAAGPSPRWRVRVRVHRHLVEEVVPHEEGEVGAAH